MAFDYSTVDLAAILQRCYEQANPPQREAVAKARTSGRVIFDAKMGLGKTFAGLISALCYKPQHILIIGSKNSLAGWHRQIKKWIPEFSDPSLYIVVRGTPYERQALYRTPGLFYVTTAGSFIRDADWLLTRKPKFDVIIVDEPQKHGYRNRKSAGFKQTKALLMHLEKIKQNVRLIFMCSGTWQTKMPNQQWAVLHLLNRKTFSSFHKFQAMFHHTVKGPFGVEVGGPKNTLGLAQITYPYVCHVTEEEANKYLPPLKRQRITIDLPDNLRTPYETMKEELYWEFENGEQIESVATILAAYTRLRQLINCPATFDPKWGVGPAIEAVVDKIRENDEHPHWKHNLIFSPFIPAIPIFKDYLCDVLNIKPQKVLIFKGGLEIEELAALEEEFRRDPQTLGLASLKYSQAWNAETCLNMYFPHFDWDQTENEQAEGRGRRTDGVQKNINAYYVNILSTITEHMFDIMNLKKLHVNLTYQHVAFLKESLRAKKD